MKKCLLCVLIWCAGAAGLLHAQVSRTVYRYAISMQGVEWSPDGSRLAFIGGNKLTIWDVAADTMMWSLQSNAGSINSVRWKPDGKEVAYSSGNAIGIWNPGDNKLRVLAGNDTPVEEISWSPDGKKIACASGTANTMSNRIWDAELGKVLFIIPRNNLGYGCSNHQAIWHPDGSQIIFSGSCGGYADICDPATGEVVDGLNPWYNNAAVYASVRSLSYSPDGGYIAAGHYFEFINIFNCKTGINQNMIEIDGRNYGELVVAWSPSGNILASGRASGEMMIFNPVTGERINAFDGHDGAITSLSWSPDGRKLASTGEDGAVKIWEANTLLSSVDEITTGSGGLQVYPNPIRDMMQVEFSPARPGTVHISLLDMKGSTIFAMQRQVEGGRELESIDLAAVSSGVYLLQLRMPDGATLRRKVEVVR